VTIPGSAIVEISLGTQNLNRSHYSDDAKNVNGPHDLTTAFSGMICHPWARTCYNQPQPAYQI